MNKPRGYWFTFRFLGTELFYIGLGEREQPEPEDGIAPLGFTLIERAEDDD